MAVKIAYVGICGTDMHVFAGHMDNRVGFEELWPEISGYVHQIGSNVKGFQIGQPVVVRPLDHCRMSAVIQVLKLICQSQIFRFRHRALQEV